MSTNNINILLDRKQKYRYNISVFLVRGDNVLSVKEQDLNLLQVGKKEQYAARIIFFVAGFGISTWAPMIPIIKERLQIAYSWIVCTKIWL